MTYLIVMPQITKIKEQYYPFPIGIAYVSSALKATGRSVFTLNLNYKEGELSQILREHIEKNNINVVAIGGLTAQYRQIKEIIDNVKEINPEILTIVGGGIITSDPISAMEALETAEYGIIGEGEVTICELAMALEKGSAKNQVDGLIFKEHGQWVVTGQRKEIMDLDSLPYPDYEGFEFDQVLTKMPTDIYAFAGSHFATIGFGRSCPYNCTFCFHPSGSKYRQRTLDSIFKELDFLLERYPIKNLAITDELFAYKKEYVYEFCSRIKKYNIGFVVSLRVDIVTKELLQLLKDSGCLSVCFGLESADNRILKSMRKNITVEQIEDTLTLANEVGINSQGNFIFGDLEETFETATNTLNWWEGHPQFQIALHWIVVYPGSYLYKVACERGLIKDRVKYIRDGCPYINISKLSDEEYRVIANKIDTVVLNRTDFLNSVEIISKGFGKVDLLGNCPVCGEANHFFGLDVFRPLTNSVCCKCSKTFNILVADYIDGTVERNISRLLSIGKIALWPITNIVPVIVSKAPSLKNENVYFIDSSSFKQGGDCLGKKVYSPSVISEQGIDFVIISLTTSVANEIQDIIHKEYKNVKRIIFAGELVASNFK